MTKKTFSINASNQKVIRDYILKQFTHLSWWPTEGPLEAREEFDALDDLAGRRAVAANAGSPGSFIGFHGHHLTLILNVA